MSSVEWVHCNKCYRTPSTAGGQSFYFGNCSHMLCKKCVAAPDGSGMRKVCCVCEKQSVFLEINRNLRPDIATFFRNPSDLASQYMGTLKKVLEFQAMNRSKLMQHTSEKAMKTLKFAERAQAEIKRRAELERKAVEERKQLQAEADKCRLQCEELRLQYSALESRLESRNKEIEQLRKIRQSPFSAPRSRNGVDSGVGSNSSSDISFVDFVTSTPIQGPSPVDRIRNNNNTDFFGGGDHLSPIVPGAELNTPAMLGLKKKGHSRRSSSAVVKNRSKETAPPFDFGPEPMSMEF